MATDEDLIAAVAAGDDAALAVLYRRYERPLHAFLARYTGGRDVDDLVQETWLRVVRAVGRFDAARRFSTWLFQIALNLARDWHRRPPPEPVDPERTASLVAPDVGAARQAGLDVERLLAALPEPQRAVVILRHFHDLGEDEVAAILAIPRGTVKSRLHNAMARLIALADPSQSAPSAGRADEGSVRR
jgi:RNA polymerase sigma-70 factor (ECF subfamily)